MKSRFFTTLAGLTLFAATSCGVVEQPGDTNSRTTPIENACPDEAACEPGAYGCMDERRVVLCTRDENGCAAWEEIDACAEDKVCYNGGCFTPPEMSERMLAYTPLQKPGCELRSGTSAAAQNYLDIIAGEVGQEEAALARGELLELHRDLRCMSALDFKASHELIKSWVEEDEEGGVEEEMFAPLLFVLSEHGAGILEPWSKVKLALMAHTLEARAVENEPIASGIGLAYARGAGLVRLTGKDLELVTGAMGDVTWISALCGFTSQVFRERDDETAGEAFCLYDPCPRAGAPGLPAGMSLDEQAAYRAAQCGEARDELDAAVGTGRFGEASGVGGDQPGANDTGEPGSLPVVIDSLAACMGQVNAPGAGFGAGGGFACAVATAVGDRSLGSVAGEFNAVAAGFDIQNMPGGCADPLSQGKKTGGALPANYERNRYKHRTEQERSLEKDVETAKELAKDYDEKTKACRENNDCAAAYAATQALDKIFKRNLPGKNIYAEVKDGNLPEVVKDTLVELEEEAKKVKKENDKEYGEDREASDKKYGVDTSSAKDCVQGGACGGCSIADAAARETNKCLGLASGIEDSFDPLTTGGGFNPDVDPYIYPDPEDTNGSGAATELADCAADAFGWGVESPEAGADCGALILCAGTTHGSVISGQCSCGGGGGAALPPGYGFEADCQTQISCPPGEECTCALSTPMGASTLPTTGGMPEPSFDAWVQVGEAWSAEPPTLQDPPL